MTRDAFIAQLRRGLAGLPDAAKAEIVADYETHFAEGLAAGRPEDEIAAALGDPDRLAREQRAEAGVRRWEAERNPQAAAGAVFAVLGLGAIDILILLPILIAGVSLLLGFAITAIVIFLCGVAAFTVGPFQGMPGGPWTPMLIGLGLMALAVAFASILTLVSIGLVNGLVWYGRLHYRLLKPAIEPSLSSQSELARS